MRTVLEYVPIGMFTVGVLGAGWTIWAWWVKRKEERPRPQVIIAQSGLAFPIGDRVVNVAMPVVKVRAAPGPVGIDSVFLRFVDPADLQRFTLAAGPVGPALEQAWPGTGLGRRAPAVSSGNWDPMDMHVVLATGEQRSWAFWVSVFDKSATPPRRITARSFRLIAVVVRSDGADPIESSEFVTEVSWTEPDHLPKGPL